MGGGADILVGHPRTADTNTAQTLEVEEYNLVKNLRERSSCTTESGSGRESLQKTSRGKNVNRNSLLESLAATKRIARRMRGMPLWPGGAHVPFPNKQDMFMWD